MSGDPLRTAFRAALEQAKTDTGVDWKTVEVENVFDTEDGATNFIALEFGGGSESQMTFGAPGQNWWDERGQVLLRVVAPLNAGKDTVEDVANKLRLAFANRRFTTADNIGVRTNSAPPQGSVLGARWILSIAIAYRIYNVR